jgi:hypothetical protein
MESHACAESESLMSKPKPVVRDLLSELTPEHALMNLFASDEWPVEADAEVAARIIVQSPGMPRARSMFPRSSGLRWPDY